ncbi:MAG: hypothetical protein GY798_04770, partial [Hyphomicrobiales bacterium]|nr:hypothetical protein [Hyphomicrobiales bacterium]
MITITAPLVIIASATTAFAGTTDWTGTTSSDWFDASNWDAAVPTASDKAIIDTATPNATIISDQVTNGAAAADVLEVIGTGSFTVEDGGYLSADDFGVGFNDGDDATATVSGSIVDGTTTYASTVELTGNLVLGTDGSGSGTLILSEGGELSAAEGISMGGNGLLVIGGPTTAVAPGTIETPTASSGELFATGGEILFNHTAIETDGYEFSPEIIGTVALNATSGYTILTGDNSTMTGTVTVDGATLAVANQLGATDLIVGNSGTDAGFIMLDGSDAAITGDATIGDKSGSSGSILVSGDNGNDASTFSVGGSVYVGKDGSGVLVLAEAGEAIVNDGTGTIEVAESSGSTGVVAFGAEDGEGAAAAGTLSAAAIKFGSGTGSLVFNHTAKSSHPLVLAAAISGKGSIEVLSGYTELSGDNGSFSGTTTVDGGYLTLSGDLDGSALTVGDEKTGGELVIENSASAKISGSTIVGNQADASGTVIVSGATETSGGSLEQSTLWSKSLTVGGSGTGMLAVNNGALVDVNAGDSSLLIASEAGATGTFSIGSPSGDTPLGTGTLKAKSIEFGDGDGTLLFNHADDSGTFAFDHTISGAGTIKAENGYTSLQGTLTDFTGTTNVKGGSLSVDTTLPGEVTVVSGTLLGTGTLTDLATIQDGGTLAPGNSVGTLKTADVTFDSGSVFAVEIDSDGSADLLKSSGDVEIDGGTVDVTADTYYVDESSSGEGFHLSALTEPDVRLSPHPALALRPMVYRKALPQAPAPPVSG